MGWPRMALADICTNPDDIKCGPFGTQLNKAEFRKSGVPLWGIKHVNRKFVLETDEFVDEEVAERLRSYDLIPGDVVMTRKGTIGNCAIYPSEFKNGIMHSDLLRLRINQHRFDPVFFVHQLQHSLDVARQLNLISGGAVMPSVNVGLLKQLEVLVPPLDDQKRIAHLLGKVECLIAQRKQHLQQLDALLKSVFLEMFGDPVKNEKGWDRTTIGKIIKVASGNGLTSKDMNPNGLYKVYGGNGVNGVHTEFMFEEPTLVIGRVGYYCGSVHITNPKSWITDNALYVKELLKKTDLVFLKHLLLMHDLNKVAGRAAQPLVSGSRIYPITTIDVPCENQTSFSLIAEKVDAIKTRYQQSLADLESLYGTLSQKAFAGELDLSRVNL